MPPKLVGLLPLLFNLNLGGFFRGSFWGRGEESLKLVRFMLEAWNLVCKHTHTRLDSEKISCSNKVLLILFMPAFFCHNGTFTRSNIMRAMIEIF